jgi:MFS family permease
MGVWFARVAPAHQGVPGRKAARQVHLPRRLAVRTFIVMVASATTGSLLFNLTTNGNAQLLSQRLDGLVQDPALLGALLGGIYALASVAQVVVGRLLDRLAVKPLFLSVVVASDHVCAGRRQQRLGLVRLCGGLHGGRLLRPSPSTTP